MTDDNHGNDNDFHDDFQIFFFLTFISFMLLSLLLFFCLPYYRLLKRQHFTLFIFAWIFTDSTLNVRCHRMYNDEAWGIIILDSLNRPFYAVVEPLISKGNDFHSIWVLNENHDLEEICLNGEKWLQNERASDVKRKRNVFSGFMWYVIHQATRVDERTFRHMQKAVYFFYPA